MAGPNQLRIDLLFPSIAMDTIRLPRYEPLGLRCQVEALLKHHGCTLKEEENGILVTLPPGTTKKELWPRVHYVRFETIRFWVLFMLIYPLILNMHLE